MSTITENWKKGDHAILDNLVSGKVQGWFENYVVFQPCWNPASAVWGSLKHSTRANETIEIMEGKPLSALTKNISLSLLLVHPSNLTKI